MIWSYGITTVPSRITDLFPRTLASLQKSGFIAPRLFVDGVSDPSLYSHFNLEVTYRSPVLRTFGNWILALWELYLREPHADRYAIFQDDFVTYNNLKAYLESCELPAKGYWNLYTFPPTHQLPPPDRVGWYNSNQRGRGALALIFNREGVTTLLSAKHMIDRPQDNRPSMPKPRFINGILVTPQEEGWTKGQKTVDGAIAESFNQAEGWTEYIHNPSLIQHIGKVTSMQNNEHPQAPTFLGESHDAMEFLPCPIYPTETSAMQSILPLRPSGLLPTE